MSGMDPVPIKVAGELDIPVEALPQMSLERVKSALTVANEEREKAAAIKQFGWWDMPEVVTLYRIERRRGGDHVICIPRGFIRNLLWILDDDGVPYAIDDQRSTSLAAPGYYMPFAMRDYQGDAASRILEVQQGIWKAPAGSGKTVGTLGAIAWSGQRAFIIVNKTALANQWRLRGHQFFGFPIVQDDAGHHVATLTKGAPSSTREVGLIGNGVWEERELTVVLRQTLHERAWQLDATNWWRTWGFTTWDETHGATAETAAEISRHVTSLIVSGVSATPFKSPIRGQVISILIGPIIHETPRDLLYERKVLIRPRVEVLEGDFYAPFHPNHDAEHDGDRWTCLADGCRREGRHSHRNNYSSVVKKLVEDEERNARIARRIVRDRGHVHLVPSGQLKHLTAIKHALVEAGWPPEKIWFLRGEENAAGKDQQIIQQVEASDEAVVLSTIQVSGEGMDVPRIDRVHVVFAMRDEGALTQLAGRGERVADGKVDSVIIDYREPRSEVLEGQYGERDRVYRMAGYAVERVPCEEAVDAA